jgi:hypothetical protein
MRDYALISMQNTVEEREWEEDNLLHTQTHPRPP